MRVATAGGTGDIDPKDLEVDTYRSSDNAEARVRITHLPSGKVGEGTHRSTEEARRRAMADLRNRLNSDSG
jgi:protein subunit release factor A